jgi:uncharacterized iron-regulated membrane protein
VPSMNSNLKPYAAVWRWHFYVGLLVAPVLLIMAITGALYLFEHEIERVWYADLIQIKAENKSLNQAISLQQQSALIAQQHPNAQIVNVIYPRAADETFTWKITNNGVDEDIFIDANQAIILGKVDSEWRLMKAISRLHGKLLMDKIGGYAVGSWLVELTASWVMVMMVTGAYLWWPRKRQAAGVVYPRLKEKGRKFWRDVHAVPAFFNLFFVVFLVLSGLPWATFWGDKLASFGTLNPNLVSSPGFSGAPTLDDSQMHTNHHAENHKHHHAENADLPWAVRKADAPTVQDVAMRFISLDKLTHLLQANGIDTSKPKLTITFPQSPVDVFTISYSPKQAQQQRTLYINPYSGAVMQDIPWQQYSALGKTVEFGVATHEGKQFGAVNQWGLLIVCITIVMTIVAGITMWLKRRNKNTLSAPVANNSKLPFGLKITLGSLFILLPLAGLSFLLVLAILYIKRLANNKVN